MEERFIERNSVAEFCEALRKNNAEFKGYFKRTFWDGDSEKGFIVKLSINEERPKDYFIATEKVDGTTRLGKLEVLSEEVAHDFAVSRALDGQRHNKMVTDIIIGSMLNSESFELINENTDFYDFVTCFCK